MLTKIKSIFVLALLAAGGGFVAYLSDVDFNTAFGPSYGAIAAAVVGYFVKETYPAIVAYLSEAFDVDVK